jgi:general L-amino acid transport system permease protein
MATTSPNKKAEVTIPFWRDVRVLAVIGQLIALVLVLAAMGWFINNFLQNAETQGLKISFDFLNTTAAFEIAEGIQYKPTDTFGRALWVGMVNTIRVSFLGIILTTLLGTVLGVARLSTNWLISRIATVYIEIIRNIPLLVLLFFLYFAVILKLPPVKNSIQPFGLPVYLNQRGITLPGLEAAIGFPIWLAFILLAVIAVIAVWIIQSRQEETTGESQNKIGAAVIVFLVIVIVGWWVTSAFISDQSMMTPGKKGITSFDDFGPAYLAQINRNDLKKAGMTTADIARIQYPEDVGNLAAELEAAVVIATQSGDETQVKALEDQLKILNKASITVCGLKDSSSIFNATSQLRQRGIVVKVKNDDTLSKVTANYAKGDCDLYAADSTTLISERGLLEDPTDNTLSAITVTPLVANVPAPSGFNIQGGVGLSPEYAALLFGLTLYTSAFAAEIVRAGILAVSKGQSEAAKALGLNESQRLRLIVLPQAMRVIIPPMTSQYLNLTKNSSLAIAIAYPDLVSVGNTVLNQSGFAVQVIIIFMVSYLTLSLAISGFLNWYNKKVALVER